MYCSNCGGAVTRGLTYCNRCGEKLNADKPDARAKTSDLRGETPIIAAIVFLFIFGLTALGFLLTIMRAIDFGQAQILGFASIALLMLIGLEAVLISRLFRHRSRADKPDTARHDDPLNPRAHDTKELEAQSRLRLEPVSSVTDHTTRTLDPIKSGH
jgi:hypothetical protein